MSQVEYGAEGRPFAGCQDSPVQWESVHLGIGLGVLAIVNWVSSSEDSEVAEREQVVDLCFTLSNNWC